MSVLFMESFDSGTINPITDGGWKWQPGTLLPRFLFNPLIGKQGGGCRVHESGYLSHFPIPIPPEELPERLILQFDLYIDPATPAYNSGDSTFIYNQSYLGLYNYSGEGLADSGPNSRVSGMRFLGGNDGDRTGIIRFNGLPGSTGSQNIINSSPLPEGFWYHVAFEWEENRFRLYVDGILEGSASSSNNSSIGINGLGGIRLGPGSQSVESDRGHCIIDNLILIADDGISPSEPLGPVRVEALRPSSVQYSEPWEQTPSGKPQSEILSGPLDFEEYIYTNVDGRQIDTIFSTPSGPEAILAVQQGLLARRSGGTDWNIDMSMGDDEVLNKELSIDPEGGPVLRNMSLRNPLTDLPWTRQDIASTRWRVTPNIELPDPDPEP